MKNVLEEITEEKTEFEILKQEYDLATKRYFEAIISPEFIKNQLICGKNYFKLCETSYHNASQKFYERFPNGRDESSTNSI